MQVAWTMSTRHPSRSGRAALVIGNMMYFESSYPNYVYAIDLDSYWRIAWKFAPNRTSLRRRSRAAIW